GTAPLLCSGARGPWACYPRVDRQRDLECRALSGGRGDLEGPPQGLQALLDAEETETPWPGPGHYLLDRKPRSVVAEEAVHPPALVPHLEMDVGGGSMFGDIGQALLHDAVEGRLEGRRQSSCERAVHVDVEPCPRRHPLR